MKKSRQKTASKSPKRRAFKAAKAGRFTPAKKRLGKKDRSSYGAAARGAGSTPPPPPP